MHAFVCVCLCRPEFLGGLKQRGRDESRERSKLRTVCEWKQEGVGQIWSIEVLKGKVGRAEQG